MHPRLLTTLVLMDPVFQRRYASKEELMLNKIKPTALSTSNLSTYRRDIWPSREDAAEGFKKSKFYQQWDPRVLDRYIKYGLRDLPTAIYPLDKPTPDGKTPVTLATTKHQEVFSYTRPNYNDPREGKPVNRTTHPDLDNDVTGGYPFYRPEPTMTFARLPHLRPSVLYLLGGESELSAPSLRKEKMDFTGTGYGGSGGAAEDRVRTLCYEGVGHLFPLEIVDKCADAAAEWVGSEMQLWREQEAVLNAEWSKKSKIEKLTVDEEWKRNIGPPLGGRRAPPSKPKL